MCQAVRVSRPMDTIKSVQGCNSSSKAPCKSYIFFVVVLRNGAEEHMEVSLAPKQQGHV